jgi:shikimate dehydrogenase
MIKACVIGNPIEHSLSPAIFRYLAKKMDVNIQYEKKLVHDLEAFKKEYFYKDVIGCNVTYPFKEDVIKNEELLSRDVRFLQASNMIFNKDNKLHFYNTDWMGFKESLKNIPEKALIIGFGGTARSVLYALCQMGTSQVEIAVRTPKYLDVLKNFQIEFPRTKIIMREMPQETVFDELVVNTAPLNVHIEIAEISRNSLVYDVNYAGEGFHKNHVNRQDGLSMLIYQALITWEIWFHTVLDKNKLHKELRENIL